METINKIIQFLKDVAHDERIPEKDKKILLVLIGLIVSPIDFIPDWIPLIGLLDDIFMIALVLDYFFEYLDSKILLSHYPFGMKSFVSLRRASRWISWLTPAWLRDRIWDYKPDIHQ